MHRAATKRTDCLRVTHSTQDHFLGGHASPADFSAIRRLVTTPKDKRRDQSIALTLQSEKSLFTWVVWYLNHPDSSCMVTSAKESQTTFAIL